MSPVETQLPHSAEHGLEAKVAISCSHCDQSSSRMQDRMRHGRGREGGRHLIADGEGEPVGDGQTGIEQLRHVPGVGVRGLRKAEVDVDGPAVLWVDAAQRAADGCPPVPACSAPSPGQWREGCEQDMEGWWRGAAQHWGDADGPILVYKACSAPVKMRAGRLMCLPWATYVS